MTPARIALVTSGFAEGFGGVPTVCRWLIRQLEADDAFEVEVFDLATSSGDAFSRRVLRPRTWVRRSLRGRRQGRVTSWGANLVEVEPARYLPRAELTRGLATFDLIQVVCGSPALGNAVLRAGPPVMLQTATLARWERASSPPSSRAVIRRALQPCLGRLEVSALRGATMVQVENAALEAHVRELGQSAVEIAPPGVDVERFHPAEKPDAHGPLLSVCRLDDPRKGLDRLVRAYAIAVRNTQGSVPDLLLVGARSPSPALREAIDSSGLADRIRVRSDVGAEELPEVYRTASCFVQTSYEEGYGMSTTEAMASGIPVIASRTAGSESVATGTWSVRLVDEGPDFEQHFAAQVLSTLAPQTHGALAVAAREHAETSLSDRAAFARFRRHYEQAL